MRILVFQVPTLRCPARQHHVPRARLEQFMYLVRRINLTGMLVFAAVFGMGGLPLAMI
jgi:hypothetical protein